MIVCLDLGNSRLKWRVRAADGSAREDALAHATPDFAAALGARLASVPAPARVLLASVAGAPALAAVQDAVRAAWNLPCELLRTQAEQCGVRNAYPQPGHMGVDRWLAMIAAWRRWQCPVCIVDAGTAVTVDVVGADGLHLGGFIVPGMDLARSLLQEATAGIRGEPVPAAPVLGDSTVACVANGSLVALLGMVRTATELMQRACGPKGVLVLTGGAGPQLQAHLPAGTRHVPGLVFDGMECVGGVAVP